MSDPFGQIGQFLLNLLIGWGLEAGLAAFLLKLVGAAALGIGALFSTFLLIWGERKLLARLQDRLGPNRLGPFGIIQTVGDFAKLVTKEIIIPSGADKVVFLLAPMLVVMSVVGVWAVIPFAPHFIGTDINVGVLYIVSVGGIGILGIMLAGWSSNNKYSLLGAFRAVAQLVSYEVPMVLVLLIPVMLTGSMGLGAIVEAQQPDPLCRPGPAGGADLLYLLAGRERPGALRSHGGRVGDRHRLQHRVHGLDVRHVLCRRVPARLRRLGTDGHPLLGRLARSRGRAYPLLGLVYFFIKTSIVWFSIIWVRMSLPRVRIDQMLALNWKLLTPLALGVVVVTAVADKLAPAAPLGRALVLLGANGLVLVIAVLGLAAYWAYPARTSGLRGLPEPGHPPRPRSKRVHDDAMQLVFLLIGAVTLLSAIMVVSSPQAGARRLVADPRPGGRGGALCPAGGRFPGGRPGGGLHRRHRHPDHLRRDADPAGDGATAARRSTPNWWAAALAALLLFGALLALFGQVPALAATSAALAASPRGMLEDLGQALVDVEPLMLPFEVASVLLLAALIGAIVIARPPARSTDEGR